jgi:hypothetical protein
MELKLLAMEVYVLILYLSGAKSSEAFYSLQCRSAPAGRPTSQTVSFEAASEPEPQMGFRNLNNILAMSLENPVRDELPEGLLFLFVAEGQVEDIEASDLLVVLLPRHRLRLGLQHLLLCLLALETGYIGGGLLGIETIISSRIE